LACGGPSGVRRRMIAPLLGRTLERRSDSSVR
jgi:hypothetical protein